jgi:hypothetical protein
MIKATNARKLFGSKQNQSPALKTSNVSLMDAVKMQKLQH